MLIDIGSLLVVISNGTRALRAQSYAGSSLAEAVEAAGAATGGEADKQQKDKLDFEVGTSLSSSSSSNAAPHGDRPAGPGVVSVV